MATQPTNNPVPSESPRDLKFNAGKIDEFVTSLALKYQDRFGTEHYTIEGLRQLAQEAIAQFGWITVDSFQDGATLTLPNQVLRDESTGEYYRWDGVLPKEVPADSTPADTGGVGSGAWISVGDAALRKELSEPDGFKYIGQCESFEALRTITPEFEGQRILLKGWHADSTLGSGEFIAKATSEPDDGGVIAGSGALKWCRLDSQINTYTYGATTSDDDYTSPLQKAMDAAASGFYQLIITEDHELPVSDTLLVKSGLVMEWRNDVAYIKLTGPTSMGGVIGLLGRFHDNGGNCSSVRIVNPRIDANNIGYPSGDYQGENGISGSAVSDVEIYGGHVKNCARSTRTGPVTGGKAFHWEYGVDNVRVIGTLAENCYVAYGASGQQPSETYSWASCINMQYIDVVAKNCECALLISRAHSGSVANPSAGLCDVRAIITAHNCGLGGSTTSITSDSYERAAVVLDRAADSNVNVTIINDEKYGRIDSALRMSRGYNNRVAINFNGKSRVLFNNNPAVGMQNTGIMVGNVISLQASGDSDYAADMALADAGLRNNDIIIMTATINKNLLTDNASGSALPLKIIDGTNQNPVKSITGQAAQIFLRFNDWLLIPPGNIDLTGITIGSDYSRCTNHDGSITLRFNVNMAAGASPQTFNLPVSFPETHTLFFASGSNVMGANLMPSPFINAITTKSITLQEKSASAPAHQVSLQVTGVIPI